MSGPYTVAEAWADCADEWHVTLATYGYSDAKNIFYSGAAAMLAMVAAAGRDGVLDFLLTAQAELKEYFEEE